MRGGALFAIFYPLARALFPTLPAVRILPDSDPLAGEGADPQFKGFDADGVALVQIPRDYLLTEDEVYHEAGHLLFAILIRFFPKLLSTYWSFRGFPGTPEQKLAESAAATAADEKNKAWMLDPRESWAECFSRAVLGKLVPLEKTLDYGMTLDPIEARGFFHWLCREGDDVTTTILGPSQIDEAGIAAYLAAMAPRAPRGHATTIYTAATIFGIRAEVLLAQQLHETGFYTFPHCGDTVFNGCPDFFNYAGIKTTDSSKIAVFRTPFFGTVGQAAHLCWYATADHVNPMCSQEFDPRHFVTGAAGAPLVHKGNCVTVSDLGGKWAPAVTDTTKDPPVIGYGDRIEMKIADILAFNASRLSMLGAW